MRSYPCRVVGIQHEGRLDYILENIREGDELDLWEEPDNPYDHQAVAVLHGDTRIGYIPASKRWVWESLQEGDAHEVTADGLIMGEDGTPAAVKITITIVEDGEFEAPVLQASSHTRLPDPSGERKFGIRRIVGLALASGIALIVITQLSKKVGEPRLGASINASTVATSTPTPNPVREAERVIHDNFGISLCPKVTRAAALADGSVAATCSNDERYRVMTVAGQRVAMRCSVAQSIGVEGC
ncbi:HIRAN domain-containing protein [Aestuariivirga sp.]|uniref:HIRAN domain-containing protein n=1 Tax=Aestuariivirga sp. TaxID=2650926 RepID=UPI0039E6F6B9